MYDEHHGEIGPNHTGRRLREIRQWRGQTLEVTAGLAGISFGHLGKLERGEVALSNRATVEALAVALGVDPTEIAPPPGVAGGPDEQAHRGVLAVENALDVYELGDDPGVPVRAWPEIAAAVEHLRDLMHVHADYAAQAAVMPGLLAELHAAYAREPARRADALVGMIACYSSAVWTTKRLGGRGLPLLAARAAQQCADMLESPAWRGYTTWLRGDATGGLSRPEQYRRAMRMADELTADLDDTETAQAVGMLHLSAALAAAVQGDRDTAGTHLEEADAMARRLPTEVGTFGRMWFGVPNVGIWRACIGLELGDGPAVAERAAAVNVDAIPSRSRRAEFQMDIGRALLADPRRRGEGIAWLRRAESLAPQRFRADLLVREAVADQLRAARRAAGGSELRGLAYRLGIGPELAPR
ncbi:helix-turn-helix domain-containing protein [Nocardia nova]